MALSEEDVMQALRDCYDPEIPVNIVDLGLIYKVMLTPDANSKRAFPRQRVEVEITMTSPGCPSHVTIMEQVRNRLAGIPEISDTQVNLVWEPPWTPDRISQKAREQLGRARRLAESRGTAEISRDAILDRASASLRTFQSRMPTRTAPG